MRNGTIASFEGVTFKSGKIEISGDKCHKAGVSAQSRVEAMKAALQFPQTKSTMTREEFSGVVLENHSTLTAYARMITGGDAVKAITFSSMYQSIHVYTFYYIGKLHPVV